MASTQPISPAPTSPSNGSLPRSSIGQPNTLTPPPSQSIPHPPAPPPSSSQARSINIRQHSPLPLTASQEAEVKELYYKRVRTKCADEIREFAHCCAGRTFSISWACRTQRLAMNTCMNAHAGREEEDKAREEWFRTLPERAQAKAEEERWKEEQRRKKREWWDLDENRRRIR